MVSGSWAHPRSSNPMRCQICSKRCEEASVTAWSRPASSAASALTRATAGTSVGKNVDDSLETWKKWSTISLRCAPPAIRHEADGRPVLVGQCERLDRRCIAAPQIEPDDQIAAAEVGQGADDSGGLVRGGRRVAGEGEVRRDQVGERFVAPGAEGHPAPRSSRDRRDRPEAAGVDFRRGADERPPIGVERGRDVVGLRADPAFRCDFAEAQRLEIPASQLDPEGPASRRSPRSAPSSSPRPCSSRRDGRPPRWRRMRLAMGSAPERS